MKKLSKKFLKSEGFKYIDGDAGFYYLSIGSDRNDELFTIDYFPGERYVQLSSERTEGLIIIHSKKKLNRLLKLFKNL